MSLAPEDLRPQMVARWRRYLKQRATNDDPVFGPWHDLMKLTDADFPAEASAVLAHWSTRPVGTMPGQVNPLVTAALNNAALKTRADVPRVYGELIHRIYEESKKSGQPAQAPGPTDADKAARQILDIVTSHDSPAYFTESQTYRLHVAGRERRIRRQAGRA